MFPEMHLWLRVLLTVAAACCAAVFLLELILVR